MPVCRVHRRWHRKQQDTRWHLWLQNLDLGYGLHELKNSVTKVTTAAFEPALDYCVCKNSALGFKQVCGCFEKPGQLDEKCWRNYGHRPQFRRSHSKRNSNGWTGNARFCANKEEIYIEAIDDELINPTDRRIFAIAEAFNKNYTIEEIYDKTKIDRWFLQKLKNIFNLKMNLKPFDSLEDACRMNF
jgi:carbamoyl-phosphate synthase large subunit